MGSDEGLEVAAKLSGYRADHGRASRGLREHRGGELGDPGDDRGRHARRPGREVARRLAIRQRRASADPEDERAMMLAGLDLEAPSGAAWEFLVLFLVVILGPPLLEKFAGPRSDRPPPRRLSDRPQRPRAARLRQHDDPGPRTARPPLPDVRRRRGAGPQPPAAAPELGGQLRSPHLRVPDGPWHRGRGRLGLGARRALLLLGSLLASHTLVLYPLLREAGLANDRIIASAIGRDCP